MHRLAAPLALILLAVAAPAAAQSPIHRCIGTNGGAVFTDQPCTALQASPTSAPAPPAQVAPPQAPPTLCAASPDQLRQGVIAAFASRDANHLAGLMLWEGYGPGAVIADIRSLAELMKQPLLDVATPGATTATTASTDTPAATGSTPAAPSSTGQLVLHLAGNGGDGTPRELRFDLVRQAGCLWLRSAN